MGRIGSNPATNRFCERGLMLLPIGRAEERARATPTIVYALIIANVFVFLMELLGGDSFISGYAVVPWEITHGADLVRPVFIRGVGIIPQAPGPAPIYLTLFTAMFMHSGWLHIGVNMLYLWIFGGEIEEAFGHLKFLTFYLVGGVAYMAHIGGFLTGLALSFLWRRKEEMGTGDMDYYRPE